MKIIINTKKSIPVEIGELHYEISLEDNNLERLQEEIQGVKSKLSGLENADIKTARKGLLEVVDIMLGEGAGEEVYKAYPSIITISSIVTQLLEEWAKETSELLEAKDQKQLMQEYVKKKK